MSAEFSAFRRQLPGGGEGAAPDALGPVSILEELRTQARSGRINSGDAASLEQDVGRAIGGLGTRTRAALEGPPSVPMMYRDLYRRIHDATRAGVLVREIDDLLDRLSEASVREAALQDAWAAFKKRNGSPEQSEIRLLQFAELAAHAGFDWARLCHRLDGVLEDRRQVILAVDPTLEVGEGEMAGLRERARIDICASKVAAAESDRGDYVVWLVVDHPAMPEPWVSLGAIDIFAGELWPDGFLEGTGRLGELGLDLEMPSELTDDRGFRHDLGDLGGAGVLLARVALTDVPSGEAARRARTLLESAIDLSTQESGWRLYEGELVWNELGGWSGSSLLSPEEAAKLAGPAHPAFEPTARNLGTLDHAWIDRYAAGDPPTLEAVRDARLALATLGGRDPLLTLALGTRPLERLAVPLGARGSGGPAVARAYLKPAWIRRALLGELRDAAQAALAWTLFTGGAEHRRIEDIVLPVTGPGERTFSPIGLEAAGAALLSLLDDEQTTADRLLRRVLRIVSDPFTALARLDELGLCFERLLKRSERQRNLTVHGYLPPPRFAATGATFLRELGGYAARDLFRHDAGEEPTDLPLSEERDRFLHAQEELRAGRKVVRSLFPGEFGGW